MPSPFATALLRPLSPLRPVAESGGLPFGQCPRCRAPTLFAGPVTFAPACRVCGLDFSRFNVGDGPAAFLILIVGGLIAGLAIWLELSAEPPFWLHIVLWVPLTTVATIAGLRYSKGKLLAAEWRRKAGEAGRRDL